MRRTSPPLGGFAHVYLATSDTPIPAGSPSATTQHVLKRIAVPDKAGVEQVGKEVEVMVRAPSYCAITSPDEREKTRAACRLELAKDEDGLTHHGAGLLEITEVAPAHRRLSRRVSVGAPGDGRDQYGVRDLHPHGVVRR